jgi:hypothetical protein
VKIAVQALKNINNDGFKVKNREWLAAIYLRSTSQLCLLRRLKCVVSLLWKNDEKHGNH